MELTVLAVGDVVSPAGLSYLSKHLRQLKKLHGVDFSVVNGENASMVGLTPDQAEQMFDAGADVITLGNHTWNRREIVPYLEQSPYILRPGNFAPQSPGRGWGVFDTKAGPVTVASLIGRCDMAFGPDNPFLLVERILKEKEGPLLLDFHAEATSEKLAMAYNLDGRAGALWGTHTHVPTADCQIFPGGMGYVTDLGMTGPKNSVLGVKPHQSIANFRGDLTTRFEAAPGPCKLEAVLFVIDMGTMGCTHVERVDIHD